MENNKNSIVLAVVAVATLIVAVFGATYAFFQAAGGTTVAKNVKVTTGTAGSTTFAIANAISINANQTNFASGKSDLTSSTTGTASFTAPSQVGSTLDAADLKSCYSVTVNISSNTFGYTSGKTPELLLNVTKGSTKIFDSLDITTKTSNVQVPTSSGGTTYVHTLQTTAGKTFSGTLSFAKATC